MNTITLTQIANEYGWPVEIINDIFNRAKSNYDLIDNTDYFDNDGDPQITLSGFFYISRDLPVMDGTRKVIDKLLAEEYVNPFDIIRKNLDQLEEERSIDRHIIEGRVLSLSTPVIKQKPKANPPKDDETKYTIVRHTETLGQILTRAKGNKSYNQFAKMFGVSYGTAYNWCADKCIPSPDYFDLVTDSDLCDGVTVEYIKQNCHPKLNTWSPSKKYVMNKEMINDDISTEWKNEVMHRLAVYGHQYHIGSRTLLRSIYIFMNRTYGFVSEQIINELHSEYKVDGTISTLTAISLKPEWKDIFSNMLVDLENSVWTTCKFREAM